MTIQEEKELILKGIDKLSKQLIYSDCLQTFERYNNLVMCLIRLNWKECGSREGEGLHTASKHN